MNKFLAGRRACLWQSLICVFALLFTSCAGAGNALPKVWMDEVGGYAIGGYDPVDYFVRARPVLPDTRIEAWWGGVSWKFRNIGNKQAFLAHPRVYAPRFGGVDPYLLATGRQVLGNPTLFDVYKERLYLFYSGISLSRWRENRAGWTTAAKQAWPKAALKLGLDAGPPDAGPPEARPPETGSLPSGPLPEDSPPASGAAR